MYGTKAATRGVLLKPLNIAVEEISFARNEF